MEKFTWVVAMAITHFKVVFCTSGVDKCVYIDYHGKDATDSNIGCPQIDVCKRNFKISYIQTPPYSGFPIEDIIKKCCGNCTKISEVNNFADITEITRSSMNSSDFVLPFLGSSYANSLYGYHYIPIVAAPNVFYITRKDEPALVRLIPACLQLFPLIIVCLLMAVISGFLTWIMETWLNREEFSRTFLTGWFEGFWWAFITMTTVGYGDKTPKAVATRLFCICWVIIGIASFSLLTALITGELMKANSPEPPEMAGDNVGVMKYRDYDRYVVAKQGGITTDTHGWDLFSDFFFLVDKLREKEIDGFVLDKYTLSFISNSLVYMSTNKQYESLKSEIHFFTENTIQTSTIYENIHGEHLSYGILVKEVNVYNYLLDAIRDNRLHFETRLAVKLNKKHKEKARVNIFSSTAPYFLDSIKGMSVMVGIICLFGIMYEIQRHMEGKHRSTSAKTSHV